MKAEIFFSIIIPVYNGAKTLQLVLESILNQKYKHFEVIIYDDCSTDNSLQILDDCLKFSKIDYKIVRSKKNKGTFYGWRSGLNKSRGDYIVISPQDNVMRNDRLYILNNVIKANNNPKIVTSDVCVGTIQELKREWVKIRFSLARVFPMNIATLYLFKSSLFEFDTVVTRKSENKYFHYLKKFSPSEDFAFISAIIHNSDAKKIHFHVHLPLVYKVFDRGSQTYTNAEKISLSSKAIIKSSKINWLLSLLCCSATDNISEIRLFSVKSFSFYLVSRPAEFILGSIVNTSRLSAMLMLRLLIGFKEKKVIEAKFFKKN